MKEYLNMLKTNKMSLIMSLPENRADLSRAAFEAGADAVKVHINLKHHASGNGFGRLSEFENEFKCMLDEAKGPMGIVPGNSIENVELDIDSLKRSRFSFFSFYAQHMPAHISCPQTLMCACDYTYSLGEIGEFERTGAQVLEASIVPPDEYGTRLSFRDLIKYSEIVQRCNLPVVVPTQRKILPEDVKNLYKTGVKAIMIGAIVTGKTEETIVEAVKAFRRAIDEL